MSLLVDLFLALLEPVQEWFIRQNWKIAAAILSVLGTVVVLLYITLTW